MFVVQLKTMIKRSLLFISALALFACGDNSEEIQEVKKPELNLSAEQIKDFKSAAKVFDAMPTPIEMAEIIKESKVVYDVKVLNDPKKTSQYVTSIKQSLNLGVYFANGTKGFEVKGTSLKDYDVTRSFACTLRKPKETLTQLLTAKTASIEKVLQTIKSTRKKVNGRVNEQTVILKVIENRI